MPRDSRVHLDDILDATRKIKAYTGSLSKTEFLQDEKTLDAVVRNLEVIGEAVKKLPEDLRAKHPALEWKKMAVSSPSPSSFRTCISNTDSRFRLPFLVSYPPYSRYKDLERGKNS